MCGVTMKVEIKGIPHAHREMIKKEGELLKVYLCAPAIEGRANQALIELLARHFKVRKQDIEIVKGLKSRNKTVNINDDSFQGGRHVGRTNP